jgi:hypothetical protein
VIAQGKGRSGIETRAGRMILRRHKKKTPRAWGLTGKSGRAGREMALPAKLLVSRCWQLKYYLFVKAKAILLFYLLNY